MNTKLNYLLVSMVTLGLAGAFIQRDARRTQKCRPATPRRRRRRPRPPPPPPPPPPAAAAAAAAPGSGPRAPGGSEADRQGEDRRDAREDPR